MSGARQCNNYLVLTSTLAQLNHSLGYHRAKLRRSVVTNIDDKFHQLHDLNHSDTIQPIRTGQSIPAMIESSNADYTQVEFQSLLADELPAIPDEDEYFGDDDMLLSSQESTTTPSNPPLKDQSSICSMDTILMYTTRFAKRAAEDEIFSDKRTDLLNNVNAMLASQLTDIALRTLVVGGGRGFPRALQQFTLQSPHPETSLAQLAPAIFSRGFSKVWLLSIDP